MLVAEMFQEVEDYYWRMAGKGRLLIISRENRILCLCSFFLLQDLSEVKTFYTKPLWSIPDDTPDGSILYIDKLISYIPWTRSFRKEVEETFARRFPHFTTAVWYRPRQHVDVRYTTTRRFDAA